MDREPIAILLVEDNPGDARLFREFLSEVTAVQFDVSHAESLSAAIDNLKHKSFDVVLLDLRLPDSQGFDSFIRIRKEAPDVPILVLTGLNDEELAIRVVGEGAQDYLVKGQVDGESLARAIRYAIARHESSAYARRPAEVSRGTALGFFGAKGGVGATTVVLNVAAAIARKGLSTIAAEIRPDLGSFSAQLGRSPVENLGHLSNIDADRIDESELRTRLMSVPWGARVLFGPQKPEEYGGVSREQTEVIVEHLAWMADYVVLDILSYPPATAREAARHCDSVVLVTTPDPACIISARTVSGIVKSWGIPEERMGLVVVNNTSLFASIDLREIRSQIGCEILGTVPMAADDLLAACRRGEPLVINKPDCPCGAALTGISMKLTEDGN